MERLSQLFYRLRAKVAGLEAGTTAAGIASAVSGLTDGTPNGDDLIAYVEVTPEVAATAEGEATDVGTSDETITVGGKIYTVMDDGTADPDADEIDAGATLTGFADNIATKVTADTADTLCTAENTAGALVFTANDAGDAGNDITLETTDENLTLDAEFAGGVTAASTTKHTTITNLATAIDGILNP